MFYFDAWAFSIFDRGIRANRTGNDNNPGAFDIFQAVYLQGVDYFVTDDRSRRRLLRQMVFAFHREKRVLSYDEFKRLLYSGIAEGIN